MKYKLAYITILSIFVLNAISSLTYADTTDDEVKAPTNSNLDLPDNADGTAQNEDENLISPDKTDYYEDDVDTTSDGSNIINPFEISITLGTQNPFNKSVPLWIVIVPKIDADRAEVTWDSRYGLDFVPKYDQFMKMKSGESYTLKTILIPEESGSYTLTVNVNEWGYGKNYSSSEDIKIKFDDKLVVDPVTEGYNTAKLIVYAIIVLLSITVLALLIFGGKKLLEWLKEWLKPPEF